MGAERRIEIGMGSSTSLIDDHGSHVMHLRALLRLDLTDLSWFGCILQDLGQGYASPDAVDGSMPLGTSPTWAEGIVLCLGSLTKARPASSNRNRHARYFYEILRV